MVYTKTVCAWSIFGHVVLAKRLALHIMLASFATIARSSLIAIIIPLIIGVVVMLLHQVMQHLVATQPCS
jgi:hypothetical protein